MIWDFGLGLGLGLDNNYIVLHLRVWPNINIDYSKQYSKPSDFQVLSTVTIKITEEKNMGTKVLDSFCDQTSMHGWVFLGSYKASSIRYFWQIFFRRNSGYSTHLAQMNKTL